MDILKGTDQTTGNRDEPLGDLGGGNRTWSPADGEQGISNRPDDEPGAVPPGDETDDARAFGDGDDREADDEDGDDEDGEGDEADDNEDEDDDEGTDGAESGTT
jgi:hypothetical protein